MKSEYCCHKFCKINLVTVKCIVLLQLILKLHSFGTLVLVIVIEYVGLY